MQDVAMPIQVEDQGLPRPVGIALVAMLVQVPVVLLFYDYFLPSEKITPLLLGIGIAASLISVGLTTLLLLGYGWIRHFLFVGSLLTLPNLTLTLSALARSSPVKAAVLAASHLWFFAALALLYSPSARSWYRQMRMRRRRGL
jgi:hypothetical protein